MAFRPGLLPNPIDPRDAWLDTAVAGEESLPEAYLIEGLKFEAQGAWPMCAAFAGTKVVEEKDEYDFQFSQPDLFFKSGGGRNGTYFRAVLEAARTKGLVDYDELPMPADIYSLDDWDDLKTVSEGIEGKYRIEGYARVLGDSRAIKEAILEHGPVLAGIYCGKGYWQHDYVRTSPADNHAVLIVGWSPTGWWLFDSLQDKTGFSGYHHISDKNEFYNLWAITKLRDNWKVEQEKKQKDEFEYCLNHYGKPRNLKAEQEAAKELEREFKKFKNQSVWEAAGKFWTVYVNALCYGGYNTHYFKPWPIWKPGDLINDCYHWRRTGKHAFNLNKPRNQQ